MSGFVYDGPTTLVTGAAALGILLIYFCLRHFVHSVELPRPPGPPGLPLIGNVWRIPADYPWAKFHEWKGKFGHIVRLHGLGNEMIVLNTWDAINDLLVKKGYAFSHRPRFTLVLELMGLERSFIWMSNDKAWQLQRKLAHTVLNLDAVKKYHSVQEDVAALLSIALIEEPHLYHSAAGRIVASLTYGIPPEAADNEYIIHAEATVKLTTESSVPGASILDIMPILKHLPIWTPFATFHALGKKGRDMLETMIYPPFLKVKSATATGHAPPSFVRELLLNPSADVNEDQEEYEEAVAWAAGSMFGAGGETTYGTMMNLILAMVSYPDVQHKAQEELNRVVGNRLPTFEDRDSLPYVNALIKEILRWHPLVPTSIPHRSAQEVLYDGFYIPKNTTVIPNIIALAQVADPEYPPEHFIPERFLSRKPSMEVTDPTTYVFGFGRRICPGRHLAENSIYIMTTYLIHCFNMSAPKDAAGITQPINPTWKTGLTCFPDPFQCEIRPRSEEIIALCRQRAEVVS